MNREKVYFQSRNCIDVRLTPPRFSLSVEIMARRELFRVTPDLIFKADNRMLHLIERSENDSKVDMNGV